MTNQEVIDGLLEVREEIRGEGCDGCDYYHPDDPASNKYCEECDWEDSKYTPDERMGRMINTINSAIAVLKQPIKAPCPACNDSGRITQYVERPGPAGEIEVRCPCGGGK